MFQVRNNPYFPKIKYYYNFLQLKKMQVTENISNQEMNDIGINSIF